jgi:hypothetical protein
MRGRVGDLDSTADTCPRRCARDDVRTPASVRGQVDELDTDAVRRGGGKASVRLDSGLPSGPWQAHLHLRSGSTEREAVARLTFPGLVATPSGFPHLLPLVAVLLLLLAAVAVLSVNRRRA